MSGKGPWRAKTRSRPAGQFAAGSKVVVDASALLALLQEEDGADVVERHLAHGQAFISAVNLSETIAKLVQHGMPEEDVRSALAPLPIEVRDFDEAAAWATAALWPATKARGLSLGDRACLALAASLGASALTGDREWRTVAGEVRVVFIRSFNEE